MNKILYVLLCSSLVLFSCERKVDDTAGKISVLIPLQNSILQGVLDPLSVMNSMGNDDEEHEEFNMTITPAFGASAAYPVNCYLVAVGSDTTESVFSNNYCGRRSGVNGQIEALYKFGPFVGLVPAGSDLELSVPSGERRKVYVFALHAQNPAACITLTAGKGQNPSKENFSRPHLVGTSATFSVVPGQTATVPISMVQPIAANSIEDCVFPTLQNDAENVANRIILERKNFPYDVLSPARSGDSNPLNRRCDYIDVSPKYEYTENSTLRLKPGFLPNLKSAYITMDNLVQTTFPSKEDCQSLINGVTVFPIQTTESSVRRWISLPDTLNGTVKNFRIDTTDASISPFYWPNIKMESVRNATSTLSNGSHGVLAKFDLVVPSKVISGQCYPFFVVRKSLEDEPVVDASQVNTLAFNASPVGGVSFFNDGTCTSTLSTVPVILNTESYHLYSFRATQGFIFSAAESATVLGVPFLTSKEYKIEVASAASSSQVSQVEITGSTYLRKRTTYNCYPITFKFKNEDGVNVPTTLPGEIAIQFAQIEGSFMSMYFDSNPTCAGGPINAGSPTVTVAPGTHLFKIYVAVTAGADSGWKNVRFKVNDGLKIHYLSYKFEVGSPNPL